jgi:hypothetical protein
LFENNRVESKSEVNMDRQTLKQALHQIAAQAIPENRDAWPEIRQRLQANKAGFLQKGNLPNKRRSLAHRRLRTASLAFLAVLVLVSALLLTPQGRVWAQQVLHFFAPADGYSFPISSAQMTAAVPPETGDSAAPPTVKPPQNIIIVSDRADCARDDLIAFYLCTVRLAEDLLGYSIKGVPVDSDLLVFSSLQVDKNQQKAMLSYGYLGYPGTDHSVWIQQGIGNFPLGSEWDQVPEEAVRAVQIGEYQGEYVQGAYIVRPGATQATWTVEIPMARLRWKEGNRWYEIFKAGQPEGVTRMDQAGMSALAEMLIYLSP